MGERPQIFLDERIYAGTSDQLASCDNMGLPRHLYGYRYIQISPYADQIIPETIKQIDKDHCIIYFRLGGKAIVKKNADELSILVNDLQNNDFENFFIP